MASLGDLQRRLAPCMVASGLAASAGKRRGRHPRAWTVYLGGVAVVFATATVMAVIRWRHDATCSPSR
jgi:hypothetical protein